MEYRIRGTDLTIDTRDNHKICGYINVTERESETLYSKTRGKWFKEVIKRGAFEGALEEALTEQRDIPLLLEHNYDKQLATTADGTFTLKEDQIGLRFEATVTDESLLQEVRDRKIENCSFGFLPKKEDFESVNSRLEKRFVESLRLFECSLVKNPAYVGSLVEERSLQDALDADKKAEEELQKSEEADVDVKETEENSECSDKEDRAKCSDEDKEDRVEDPKSEDDIKEVEVEEKKEEESDKSSDEEKREMDVDTQGSLTLDKEEIRQLIREVIAESEMVAENHEKAAEQLEEDQKYYEECATDRGNEALMCRTKALNYRYRMLKLKKFEQSI